MQRLKVLFITALSVILTLQFCDTYAIKSKLDLKKFKYSKSSQVNSDGIYYKKRSEEKRYVPHHNERQPRSVISDNPTFISDNRTVLEMKKCNATRTTTTPKTDIKIVDQKYAQNSSGEYKHEVLFSNGAWRAEQGEYEDHNGTTVFVIRGVLQYYTKEGTYNTTLYIVDEFGFHDVLPPPTVIQEGGGTVDFRPDIASEDCGNGKGSYCIDPKLLALLVG